MTSFHTEVCSTATVWFCLTPSFSLYNRESERNRSRRPGRGGRCVRCVRCVVWQKQNGKTWERREWFCGCRFVCLRLSVSHLAPPAAPPPSPPHPPARRLSVAGSAGDTHQTPDPLSAQSSWPETVRGGGVETPRRWCVCVKVLREQQQEANEGGCTNESTQLGRKWGPRGVAQEEKRIQRERVYEHCAQVTREKMKNASRRRKGNIGAKQEVKADGNGGRRKKTN